MLFLHDMGITQLAPIIPKIGQSMYISVYDINEYFITMEYKKLICVSRL